LNSQGQPKAIISTLSKISFLALSGIILIVVGCKKSESFSDKQTLPAFTETYGSAYARTEGAILLIGTGTVERRWQWTDQGFATIALINSATGKDFALPAEGMSSADWQLPGISGKGQLVDLESRLSTDEGFTSEHLETIATIQYPKSNLIVQYVIWAYPGASGLRTQLRFKSMNEPVSVAEKDNETANSGIAETLPIDPVAGTMKFIGYYSDTQNRNERDTEILKEETLPGSVKTGENDWASIAAFSEGREGIVLVKESHKCVNTPDGGANTGSFLWSSSGLQSTGLGYAPEPSSSSTYQQCWANWTILYSGKEEAMELALKIFDRYRYPIDPARDIYIMANTWGSTTYKRDAQVQAREANVLTEIESQADLGIDVQQIDDGWQGYDYDDWLPIQTQVVHPDGVESKKLFPSGTYDVYPGGWQNVRELAAQKNVRLGLWSAYTISAEELIRNHEEGDFRYYKIDFANLTTKSLVDELMGRARALILHSGQKVRINWDVTEKNPRVGYFFGREYGNIYLENRKPIQPASVVYKPYTVLRDAWQISKYINLNKFQVTVQNVDRVNREVSDAWEHSHSYCVAQTLMASPIFFQETHYYTEAARNEIRPLIALYKEYREDLFKGYVFPVGDKPDNKSWSGFQNHDPKTGKGYLLLFRQIRNKDSSKSIPLHFMADKHLSLTDLRTGKRKEVVSDHDGRIDFDIQKSADFLFLRYEPKPDA
jgi:hypothetical protein